MSDKARVTGNARPQVGETVAYTLWKNITIPVTKDVVWELLEDGKCIETGSGPAFSVKYKQHAPWKFYVIKATYSEMYATSDFKAVNVTTHAEPLSIRVLWGDPEVISILWKQAENINEEEEGRTLGYLDEVILEAKTKNIPEGDQLTVFVMQDRGTPKKTDNEDFRVDTLTLTVRRDGSAQYNYCSGRLTPFQKYLKNSDLKDGAVKGYYASIEFNHNPENKYKKKVPYSHLLSLEYNENKPIKQITKTVRVGNYECEVTDLEELCKGWFWDSPDKTVRQFNPGVYPDMYIDLVNKTNSGKKLTLAEYYGERYIGPIDEEPGVFYREDGSIWYKNQTKAYKRIWENTFRIKGKYEDGIEHMCIILLDRVLVLPYYVNISCECFVTEYKYKLEEGKIFDLIENRWTEIIATVHTHPRKNIGKDHEDGGPSGFDGRLGDRQSFAKDTPNKIAIILAALDNKLYGTFGFFDKKKNKHIAVSGKIKITDQTKVDVTKLLDGYDLRIYSKKFNADFNKNYHGTDVSEI